uniref:Yippee like 4 n=1 Tax=Myotis myotis TaxID=51298 RepID=A0A7J7VM10_MYOMY|nr:yippee like 4 [Myotis myotis]
MPSCDPGPGPACLPTKTFRSYLPRCHRTYSCVHCRAHLAKHDELISKVRHMGACHSPPRPHSLPFLLHAPGDSLPVPCLHSPSKGATAEPTCLTPCESTSLFVCVRVCVCIMFLCGQRR